MGTFQGRRSVGCCLPLSCLFSSPDPLDQRQEAKSESAESYIPLASLGSKFMTETHSFFPFSRFKGHGLPCILALSL